MSIESSSAEASTREVEAARIARSAPFQALVRERSRFTWMLTAIMLATYFGFILLVAFAPEILARPIGRLTTTIGIPIGIGVIVTGIMLTAIYVHRANRRFDDLTSQISESEGK